MHGCLDALPTRGLVRQSTRAVGVIPVPHRPRNKQRRDFRRLQLHLKCMLQPLVNAVFERPLAPSLLDQLSVAIHPEAQLRAARLA